MCGRVVAALIGLLGIVFSIGPLGYLLFFCAHFGVKTFYIIVLGEYGRYNLILNSSIDIIALMLNETNQYNDQMYLIQCVFSDKLFRMHPMALGNHRSK